MNSKTILASMFVCSLAFFPLLAVSFQYSFTYRHCLLTKLSSYEGIIRMDWGLFFRDLLLGLTSATSLADPSSSTYLCSQAFAQLLKTHALSTTPSCLGAACFFYQPFLLPDFFKG